jgi:hypothetical protein
VRGWRLTTWAMSRPLDHVTTICCIWQNCNYYDWTWSKSYVQNICLEKYLCVIFASRRICHLLITTDILHM